MVEQQQKIEGVQTHNSGFESASALQIRLDTEQLLQRIEFFLRGKEVNTFFNEETNRFEEKLIDMGTKQVNERGFMILMNYCRSLINPQVVQGNFIKIEYYFSFIKEKRIELSKMIFLFFYDWECQRGAIGNITDFIMNLSETFLSRLIFNKERDSYAATMKTVESNRIEANKGFLGFGGN
jgi:hypothetical protein